MMAAQMKAFSMRPEASGQKVPDRQGRGSIFQHWHSAWRTRSCHPQLPHHPLHHGMLISGLPYSFTGQTTMDMIAGDLLTEHPDCRRRRLQACQPDELDGGKFLGEHVANIVKKLAK
jgi:hypothetical protein